MLIKFNVTSASPDGIRRAGDIADVPELEALELIRLSYAALASAPAPEPDPEPDPDEPIVLTKRRKR